MMNNKSKWIDIMLTMTIMMVVVNRQIFVNDSDRLCIVVYETNGQTRIDNADNNHES